jgi:hypothetical protein
MAFPNEWALTAEMELLNLARRALGTISEAVGNRRRNRKRAYPDRRVPTAEDPF